MSRAPSGFPGRRSGLWPGAVVLALLLGGTACDPSPAPTGQTGSGTQALAQEERASVSDEQQVVLATVAAEGRSFLARIPRGQEGRYGFARRSEFARAWPGVPYRMVTLDEADLGRVDGTRLPTTPVGAWRVPVVVDDVSRCLWTVAEVDGVYRVVEVGAAGLARELQALEGRVEAGRTDLERQLLRLFPLRADLVLLADADGGAAAILPLESARRFLPLPDGRSGEQRLTVDALLPVLEAAFARSGGGR